MKKLKSLLLTALLGVVACLPAFADGTNSVLNVQDGWILTLAGTGQTQLENSHGTTLGLDIGLGKEGKLLLPAEGGVRQNFGYNTDGNDAVFATKLYLDFFPIHFHRFELGVGANVGAAYGNTLLTWTGAPEGVVRFWLTETAGLFGRVEYPLDINNHSFGDRLNYVVGVAVRW